MNVQNREGGLSSRGQGVYLELGPCVFEQDAEPQIVPNGQDSTLPGSSLL